ncbi:MAG: NAD(P)H-hydrate dehydratase, partial [Hungatella sp.]
VLGPGLSTNPYVETLVQEVLVNAYVPIILDADALNLIAQHPELTQYYTDNIIITPHPGEMARLTGKTISEIRENLIGTARDYASLYGVTCVLKDAVTVVVGREGQIYLNTSGNSGMAKGGSGDVLTGAIAGLLAQGEENRDGAVLGVYLHGLAGDRCLKHMGAQGILAHDLAEALGTIEKNRMEAES